jgi:hypothetical protein
MAAATAAISLFPAHPTVAAPEVAYMDVRRSLLRLQELGREQARLVDITDSEAVIAACDEADVLWLESPTNPLLGLADLPRLCAFARERHILSVVHNTLATRCCSVRSPSGPTSSFTARPKPWAVTRTCSSAPPSSATTSIRTPCTRHGRWAAPRRERWRPSYACAGFEPCPCALNAPRRTPRCLRNA